MKKSNIAKIAKELEKSYQDKIGVNSDAHDGVPSAAEVIEVLHRMQRLIFPGFDVLDSDSAPLADRIGNLGDALFKIFRKAFHHCCPKRGSGECDDCKNCDKKAEKAAEVLLNSLCHIRESMKLDVAAAYAGDPAASSHDEIILSYPGLKAITLQRIAHVLYIEKVPLIPRLITEHAHTETGIDIHPGATLGKGVFIDHGTGVVIGETASIGDNVRIYQGVTLGALSFPKDACGMLIKGQKRHPTVENDVTIYSGATVLGDIVIGEKCVIGGNVWLTESLPPGSKIICSPPEQQIRLGNKKR